MPRSPAAQFLEEDAVLGEEGFVEPELAVRIFSRSSVVGQRPGQGVGRVAGSQPDQHEHCGHGQEDRQQALAQPFGDVWEHGLALQPDCGELVGVVGAELDAFRPGRGGPGPRWGRRPTCTARCPRCPSGPGSSSALRLAWSVSAWRVGDLAADLGEDEAVVGVAGVLLLRRARVHALQHGHGQAGLAADSRCPGCPSRRPCPAARWRCRRPARTAAARPSRRRPAASPPGLP